ncbi:MAG: T9SS type A sorting domain-containing protein [Bacteroidetes bacterium]|nr:T9SS type A sorting domain-containing protein [Bacteroidota bacterium]
MKQKTLFPVICILTSAFGLCTSSLFSQGTWTQKANDGGDAVNSLCNISLSITTTNSSCGKKSGSASVVATNGIAPYTYQWTSGDVTFLADSLSAGLYMVLVTDASGCTDAKAALVSDAGAPAITVTSTTNVSCNGDKSGAINLSVAGGSAPYTYFWNNGATTQNISNLYAGPFEVQITDASGCKAMQGVLVSQPDAIILADSIVNASCGNLDGAAAILVSGGTSPYSYLWSTGATTKMISNLAAGSYSVTVMDSKGCTKYGMGSILNWGAATAAIDSIIPATCGSGTGSIYISVTGGTAPYTYAWTNGATTEDIVGVVPGMYGLTIYSNGNPCTGALSTSIPAQQPSSPAICIVTVDTATGKNICVFTKDSIANLGIKQYNFYRETTQAGVFQKLGSRSASLPSAWTDQSANPLQRAWRYRIAAEDTCGNESPLSVYHKTVHLAANIGLGSKAVNLSWDNYEGFSISTYYIWRYTSAAGWMLLDSVPSNLNAYTDTPPTLINLFYFIEVRNPLGCAISLNKIPQPMKSNLNSSRSNIYKLNDTSSSAVAEMNIASSIQVYPNPSKGMFTIKMEDGRGKRVEGKIEVFNIMGGKVYSAIINSPASIITLDVPTGIYFLRAQTEEGMVSKKIVIQQ